MNKLQKVSDISEEMTIERQGNGIIIIPPQADTDNKLTVRDLMALPLSVYFLNQNSQNCAINSIAAELCGWSSQRKALGESLSEIWPQHDAARLQENDHRVFNSNKWKVFEEDVFNEKVFGIQALSFKFPWYNSANEIIGIFGCSIAPDYYPFYSMGNSLALLAKTQLLNSTTGPELMKNKSLGAENYFTKRELDVLKLLMRVKTSKEIATQLGLSHRTVEHYIENAKRKVGASSKSELIDKIIDAF